MSYENDFRPYGLDSLLQDVFLRIPSVLLTLAYGLAATRTGDQIQALFDMASFPSGYLTLYGVALASSLTLAALTPRSSKMWEWVDGILLIGPAAAVGWASRSWESASWALSLIVILIAIAIYAVAIRGGRFPTGRLVAISIAAAISSWITMAVSRSIDPIELPRSIGTLAISFFFVGLAATLAQAALLRPAIGALVAIPIILVFLLNEQPHRLSTTPVAVNDPEAPQQGDLARGNVSLREAFSKWLSSRKDLDVYRSRNLPYPVFIVSAEGGGGYAAAHSYLFLSKMQRRCPNFAQHVFAITGVSGGAVGASMFWRSLAEELNPSASPACKPMADSEDDVRLLSTDHLAPVVASLLFHDLPNKLLFGLLGNDDRAQSLIASLTHQAKPGEIGNPLYQAHYWRRTKEGTLQLGEKPAIIPVATNAVSGKRYVFAPFTFINTRCRFEQATYDMTSSGGDTSCPAANDPNAESGAAPVPSTSNATPKPDDAAEHSLDLGLFDAAVASAAFPYVTPSVVLKGWHGRNVSLVDGGYLDNSGTEAAREIVQELQDPPGLGAAGMTELGIAKPASWSPRRDEPIETYVPTCRPYDLRDTWERLEESGKAKKTAIDAFALREPVPTFELESPVTRPLDRCDVDAEAGKIKFKLNVITIRAQPNTKRFSDGQSFLFDPLRALDATRSQRGETARRALAGQLCGGVDCPPEVESVHLPAIGLIESVIDTDTLTLPLGWYVPAGRVRGMAAIVVPENLEGESGGSSLFGEMADNGYNVAHIEQLLNPP